MSVFVRNLLSTHHFGIVPIVRKHSRCLLSKERHYEAKHFKFASTANFPGLTRNIYPSIKNHDDLHKYSIENPEAFWDFQAKDLLTRSKPYSSNKVMDCNMERGQFRWFYDGKINASVNCVDRHAEKNPDKIALIWEKDEPGTHEEVSYGQTPQSTHF